jgi:hypothetical protein
MIISLTSEIEKGLIEQAVKIGTSPEALAIETLRRQFAAPTVSGEPSIEGSLVDFLGDFVGCISSDEIVTGGAQLSRDAGKQFSDGMLEKRRQGHL